MSYTAGKTEFGPQPMSRQDRRPQPPSIDDLIAARAQEDITLDQFGPDIPDAAPSEWSPPIAAPERSGGVMDAAKVAQERVDSWSDAKKDYADRVVNSGGVHIPIPPSEWSPTIGQATAANSDVMIETQPWINPFAKYETLQRVLDDAFLHAATGKGKERHARDLPFDDQPIMQTTRLVGPGFPLGQAIKKAGEAAGMIDREELAAAEAECLGAINYLAGAVAWMREQRTVAAPTSVGAAA